MKMEGYYSGEDLIKKLRFTQKMGWSYRKFYRLPHAKFGSSYYYPIEETNKYFGIDLQQYNFITKKELIEKYGVSERTIYNWQERGLPYIKLKKDNMYPVELVKEWIQSQLKEE